MAFDLTNLIAYWTYNEASGTRVDVHGGHDLSVGGGAPGVGSTTGLVYANAANFIRSDARNLFRNNEAALQIGDSDATWIVWVKLTSKPGAIMSLVSKGTSGGDRDYLIWLNSAGDRFNWTIYQSAGGGGAVTLSASTFGTPSTGVWYMLICEHNHTTDQVTISVNNGSADVAGTAAGGVFNSTNEMDHGLIDGDGATYLDAAQGPVIFFKRLLTTQEKSDMYNGGAGLTYAAMIATPPSNALPFITVVDAKRI